MTTTVQDYVTLTMLVVSTITPYFWVPSTTFSYTFTGTQAQFITTTIHTTAPPTGIALSTRTGMVIGGACFLAVVVLLNVLVALMWRRARHRHVQV